MPTLEEMRKKIESAEDLGSIVRTMKGLAAASIWQYEEAVESLAGYMRTIEMGLHIVFTSRFARVLVAEPTISDRLGAIVFGSDQGMLGKFNRQRKNKRPDKPAAKSPMRRLRKETS